MDIAFDLSALLRGTIIVLISALSISTAIAAEVALLPNTPEVSPGDQIVVEIRGDFLDEPTLGGGMDIAFDPAVFEYANFSDPGASVPGYLREPDSSSGLLSSAAAGGWFNGYTGPGALAFILFNVRPDAPAGLSTITIGASTGIAGPFVSSVTNLEQTITFTAAEVTILGQCSYTVTAPTPGDEWNLGSVQPIRWQAMGNGGCGENVSVELLDGGTPLMTLSASTLNDGAFSWFVNTTPTGANYSIRITDLDDNSFTAESGIFSIVDEPGFIFSTGYE